MRFNGAVIFTPLIEGALRDMQFFAETFGGFALLIAMDGLNFEFRGGGDWHSRSSFVGGRTIVHMLATYSNTDGGYIILHNAELKIVLLTFNSTIHIIRMNQKGDDDMSRQFDQRLEDKYEYYGELHSLISPRSFRELIMALDAKRELQTMIDSTPHDDDTSGWDAMLERQNSYIQEFFDSIGDFDNATLVSNIAFFSKSSGVRVGELERILGLSAGYISRTAKENAGKRLSIDVVWKLAKLFGISISDLVDHDFSVPMETGRMLCKFIQKLIAQTELDIIEWNAEGGCMYENSKALRKLPLFSDEEKCVIYHPDHMNEQMIWVLDGDVYSCSSIAKGQSLAIIPFKTESLEQTYYDFIFFWENSDGSFSWKKAFYCNDPFIDLETDAAHLFKLIEKKQDASKVTPEVRSIIMDYLRE